MVLWRMGQPEVILVPKTVDLQSNPQVVRYLLDYISRRRI